MAEKKDAEELGYDVLEGELCMFCNTNNLTLMEAVRDVPFFGVCHIYSMDCSNCHYHKADIEAEAAGEPVKYTLDIASEEDVKVRVIKSSYATVKVPYIGEIESGEGSNGYITNVEGVLNRIKRQVEHLKEAAEDDAERTKAKNVLKKLTRIMWGQEKAKLIIEDPTGNSAIVSPKAVKERLKIRK